MKLAVDGDLLVYKACFVTEHAQYDLPFEGSFRYKKDLEGFIKLNTDEEDRKAVEASVIKIKVVEPVQNMCHILSLMVDSILTELEPTDYVIYLSGRNNFREKVPYPVKYKGNRVERPIHYQDARDFLTKKYRVEVTEGYEADDALGIFLTKHGDKALCASIDKDLMQVDGMHWNLDKKVYTKIDKFLGYKNYATQMLMGDKTDNILGIDGIGPKTAEKMLAGCLTTEQMDNVIIAEYKKAYPDDWVQMLDSTHKLVWILREEPTKESNNQNE